MKTFGRILLGLLAVLVLAGVIVYIDGARLPETHSVSVTGVVPAAQEKVFSIITNVANGASWRHNVKSVKVLPPGLGPDGPQDHWVEDLGHGQTMTFMAIHTDAPNRRDVLLDVPNAAYGGTWVYRLSPGPTPNTTTLKITEAGYIRPAIYRFMMVHVFGPDYNLKRYMSDIQAQAAKS